MLAEVPTHEDQARKWVSTWSEERCIVRHRWISQDGKACLLASWFLSRDVAVHSGVVGASAPAPRCFKFRRKPRPGDPGGTTTADATVWQNPCSAAGGLYVVRSSGFEPQSRLLRRPPRRAVSGRDIGLLLTFYWDDNNRFKPRTTVTTYTGYPRCGSCNV